MERDNTMLEKAYEEDINAQLIGIINLKKLTYTED